MRSFQRQGVLDIRRIGAIAAAILIAFTTAATAAEPASASGKPSAQAWLENAGMALRVTESVPNAGTVTITNGEVYDRADYQAMFLLPSAGDFAYVLDLKTQQISPLPKSGALGADGNPRPGIGGATRSGARFDTNAEGRIHFAEGAREIFVEAAPPLLGPIARADLETRYPGYARRTRVYQPDVAMIAKLAAAKLPAEILVFFGSWCQICKHELPALLATLDAARNPNLKLALVAVDENVAEPKDLISQYRIIATPTILVLVDGQELGRIEEEAKVSVEADLAGILVGSREGGR